MVALLGQAGGGLLAQLTRSPNVSVALPVPPASAPPGGTDRPAAGSGDQTASGWEPGAAAMRAAARLRSMYVIVPDDPLAAVAAGWRAMWDLSAGPAGSAAFEQAAAAALTAWHRHQFELPDYYLVLAPADGEAAGPDLYLGPLRAARPRRVAIAGQAGADGQASLVLDALRSLQHGPWWPPLDELLAAARHFYAGALAEPAAAGSGS